MMISEEALYAAAPEAAEKFLSALPDREDCVHDFSPRISLVLPRTRMKPSGTQRSWASWKGRVVACSRRITYRSSPSVWDQ